MRQIMYKMEQISQDGDLIRRDIVTLTNEIHGRYTILKILSRDLNTVLNIEGFSLDIDFTVNDD